MLRPLLFWVLYRLKVIAEPYFRRQYKYPDGSISIKYMTSNESKMKALNLLFLLVIILLYQSCSKKDLDPILRANGLFSYRVVREGDGLVTFIADSTQFIKEFVWDFGDGTAQMTTSINKTTHIFTKNDTYQVKVTAKNSSNQISHSETVTVDTRLARMFDDLPASKRDTIRILYILSDESFKKSFQNLNDYEYSDYQNKLFINFLKRTETNRPVELDRLVFKHIVYTLSTDEMSRFNAGGDPVAFLGQLLNYPQDPLYKKILDEKKKEAVSRIAFFLKDPGRFGYPKYPFGGYAQYEGGHFVSLVISEHTISHELGHSFGFAHDTLRDCNYFPLMVGGETVSRGGCGSTWNTFPEFQVSGFANNLVLLEAQPGRAYRYAVPEYWRNKFPNDPVVGSLTLNYITTTPYYRSDTDLSKTLKDALIAQYNIKLAPGSATSIAENPKKILSGRLDMTREKQTIYCHN